MATLADNIPVYDMLSLCILRPVPAIVALAFAWALAALAARFLPKIFGPVMKPRLFSPPAQAWAFHCQCALFICLFSVLANLFLSEGAFRTVGGMERMETLLRADPKNAGIIRECAGTIFLRDMGSDPPAIPWTEYPSYVACLNEAQGRRLLGDVPKDSRDESFAALLDSIRFKKGWPPIPYLVTGNDEPRKIAKREISVPAPSF